MESEIIASYEVGLELSKRSLPLGIDENTGDVFFTTKDGQQHFIEFNTNTDIIQKKSIS